LLEARKRQEKAEGGGKKAGASVSGSPAPARSLEGVVHACPGCRIAIALAVLDGTIPIGDDPPIVDNDPSVGGARGLLGLAALGDRRRERLGEVLDFVGFAMRPLLVSG